MGGSFGKAKLEPDPQTHTARGKCGGPFPLWPDGRPMERDAELDDEGRPFVPGDKVINAPRFAEVRWYSCPLAEVGRKGCPSPKVPSWLVKVTDAASWMNSGGQLRDCVERPTEAFRRAVQTARQTVDAVAQERRESERKRTDLAGAHSQGRGRRK